MSIDNQTILLTTSGIAAETQAQPPGADVVTGEAEVFLQRLIEQISELGDDDKLQPEVVGLDDLRIMSEGEELNLKVGNFLPPVAISDPEGPLVDELPVLVQQVPLVTGLGQRETIQLHPAKENSKEPAILPTDLKRIISTLETSGGLGAVDDLSIEVDAGEPSNMLSKQVLNSVNAFVQTTQSTRQTVISVERPIGQSGWNQELGNRIIWMTGKSVDVAEIRVNPPHLGPLEVRINLNQDQVSVAFSAQNAVVREAIEAAMPRLREMFAGQQLNLGNVDVSQQSFSEHHRHGPSDEGSNAEQGDSTPHLQSADETLIDSIESDINSVTSGLVSYYV